MHDRSYSGSGNLIDLNSESTAAIKKAYFMLSNLWETYMNSGKMNPVAGIFLGKNNYGYVDQVEHVVTPNTHPDSDYDADAIREKYIGDAQIINADGDDDKSDSGLIDENA